MGKTKTMFVEGAVEKKSGKDAYAEKMKKRAEAEEVKKASEEKVKPQETKKETPKAEPKKESVKKIGLKGGGKIKVVGAEPEETTEPETTVEQPASSEVPATETSKVEKKPKVRSKNYKTAKAKVDRDKFYKLSDAIKILKEISYTKFDETVELHIVLKNKGLNVNITLPHSGGKQKKVEVASDATIEKLKSGKVDFDMLLATPDMMPKLVQFARVLGPRGLMPNPKNGTIIKSAKDADKFSGNSLTLKTEKEQPVVHTAIGKLKQSDKEIEENANTVFDAVAKQVVKAYIKSTMSPSLKLSV